VKAFTVECDEHGLMERDDLHSGYRCLRDGRWLPDEEVRRLVDGVPDDTSGLVPIVVT
jgi:hypothetical protein